MRLLHFDNVGKLILTDFSGKAIPPYAILSHRWGNDEVLFEHLKNNTYKSKAGYRKIKFCGKQTAQDQLQHFWIDTCCIDRWNLRELSKAINSMFRWYQNSKKCYVFLSDVLVPASTDALQQSTWEASFRESKWFTRGWTLQELIAPVSAEFFSSEGQLLGNKTSLEQLIHEITGIPIKALQNHPLDEFSVDERKEWARHRETTEEEDSVYCLLGILSITMPLSYGEGKEKALNRLQNELETITPFIVPFHQNDRFIGQDSQLAELEERIFTSKQTTKIAITGIGGIGKSQLALEFAYRTKQKYKNCAVFWVSASNMDSLHQAYTYIAQKLDIPGWDDEKEDVKKLVQNHLSQESAGQWLLIFDNVDDANPEFNGLPTPQTANLVNYLPRSQLGSIIFTTTDINTAETLAPQNTIELLQMTPDAAQRMLEKHLKKHVSRNVQEAKLLLKELSYLPLAIVQAAAYINVNKITLEDYLSRLAEQKGKDEQQHCSKRNPVATTWHISFERIRHCNKLATDFILFMACIDRNDIPLAILPKAPSLTEEKGALETLHNYSLITKRPAELALDLHRLVHLAICNWLQEQGLLSQWTQLALERLNGVFPDGNYGNRSKWRRLLPHAVQALSSTLGRDEGSRLRLIYKCATAFHKDGRDEEAEVYLQEAMQIEKVKFGEEHPSTLTLMGNLAFTYKKQGRWNEAEELQERVMETSKRVLGEEHPDTLIFTNNLALTYTNQGRWKEAEELQERVIETFKRVLGEEHPNTLISITNLASTYRNQSRWKEAEELQERAMETSKRVLGEEHPNTLTFMGNLAFTLKRQGHNEQAIKLMSESVLLKNEGARC